ncbi:MAG: hypothetical protein INR62_13355 [Rhodospirillales bacterium]|nr:hypothetical protein [Acetobacter sp.]
MCQNLRAHQQQSHDKRDERITNEDGSTQTKWNRQRDNGLTVVSSSLYDATGGAATNTSFITGLNGTSG